MALAVSLSAQGTAIWRPAPSLRGIHKIQHVIVIMQENRSFDTYFGKYPGAAGAGWERVRRVCRRAAAQCARDRLIP